MAADSTETFDIFIIGGGVNGCGVARDAAGRGYSVALAEMNDFASGTSSKATKLIHGGLRYLEHYAFRLVREALSEREVVWRSAPHIVWPLRFVLPYHKGLRPAWMLRLGLFLYDHIGGRKALPATRTLDLRGDPRGAPLKPGYSKAFEYSDCWVDDARLVVLNAKDAAERGAFIRSRCKVVSARPEAGLWTVTTQDRQTGETSEIRARALVNTGGPWVDDVQRQAMGLNAAHHVRLVQGSHIVTRKLYDHDRCYIFQNADGRILFAIPYENDFTLIGTTDRDYAGDAADVAITPEETSYLCAAASEYFAKAVTPADVVWSYSGVRPLYDDGASAAQEATRDYVVREETLDGAPAIHVFGGKITTYRRLAESVMAQVEAQLGAKRPAWTIEGALPGGDLPGGDFEAFVASLQREKPFLPATLARRLARAYGTRALRWLAPARSLADLGRDFGAGLTAREIDYLVDDEWARSAEDILWRRSKMGLRVGADAAGEIEDYLAGRIVNFQRPVAKSGLPFSPG